MTRLAFISAAAIGLSTVLAAPAVVAQASVDDYTPETLLETFETCAGAVSSDTPFAHPGVVEDTVIDRSSERILFLAGLADVPGGDARLALVVTAATDGGGATSCDFRYNAFQTTAEADIARVAETQPMIDAWIARMRDETGQTDAPTDQVVLCNDDRATLVEIRDRDETAIAVQIEPADAATLCSDT